MQNIQTFEKPLQVRSDLECTRSGGAGFWGESPSPLSRALPDAPIHRGSEWKSVLQQGPRDCKHTNIVSLLNTGCLWPAHWAWGVGGSYAQGTASPNKYIWNECLERGKFCDIIWAQKGKWGMNVLAILVYFKWDYPMY